LTRAIRAPSTPSESAIFNDWHNTGQLMVANLRKPGPKWTRTIPVVVARKLISDFHTTSTETYRRHHLLPLMGDRPAAGNCCMLFQQWPLLQSAENNSRPIASSISKDICDDRGNRQPTWCRASCALGTTIFEVLSDSRCPHCAEARAMTAVGRSRVLG
jgi:hypothetical protein